MLAAISVSLSGCLFGGGEGPAYTRAKVAPPLQIPPDLDAGAIRDRLVIPPINNPSGELYTNSARMPRPTLVNGDARDQVKIQRLGDSQWLVVADPPAVVWPRLKQYLADNGLPVARERPEAGVMESGWVKVEPGPEGSLRGAIGDRYPHGQALRFRIELQQGVRRGTSEVHIVEQLASLPDGTLPWPEQSGAGAMLADLGAYLASELGGSGISLAAQNIAAAEKARLERDADGRPYLGLRLDFDRAWATVGQALANAEIDVTDVDRDDSVFYVHVTEGDLTRDRSGRLGSLLRFGRKEEGMDLEVHLSERRSTGEVYYRVGVTAPASGPVDERVAEQMLSLIRDFAG